MTALILTCVFYAMIFSAFALILLTLGIMIKERM